MNLNYPFPWDGNENVKKVYEQRNYIIEKTRAGNKKAIVFCSSNAIYAPETIEEFEKSIIVNNNYDWINIKKHYRIRKYFSKIIIIRDIYKQWYIKGINSEINSINKLLFFLKKELNGYDITTCGGSAGGFIATLIGVKLDAERIILNSAQFNLYKYDYLGPFAEQERQNPEVCCYYNLHDYLKRKENEIYYFFPKYAKNDMIQSEEVSDVNIHRFEVNSEEHGYTMKAVCYPYILTMDKEKLDKLEMLYSGQLVDINDFYKKTVPVIDRIYYVVKRLLKKMLKKEKE